MRVHMIQQDPFVIPGAYGVWAERGGHTVTMTRCWLHEPLPRVEDADFLLVLGGMQCPATGMDECDYFDSAAEQACIRAFVSAGKAVVGSCLGAQLIGEALGGRFARSPEKEVGPVEAHLTEAGRADPFWNHLPEPFLAGAWHNDMPGLTPESEIIAYSAGCPRQIVRYGRFIYGLQTHMEFTHEIAKLMIENAPETVAEPEKHRYVQTVPELLAFDYTEMNEQLITFLTRLSEAYAETL